MSYPTSGARGFFDAHQFTIHRSPMVYGEWIRCSCGWGHYETQSDDFDWGPIKQEHLVEEMDRALEAGLIRELRTEGLKSYDLPD